MWFAVTAIVVALACDGTDGSSDRAALEKQCRELGERIEKSINAGDPSILDDLVDEDALLDAAIRDLPANESFLARVRDGVKKNIHTGADMTAAIANHGSFKFLRVHWDGDEPRLLFRVLSNAGVNYHDYYVSRGKGGSIVSRDKYNYALGEKQSETLHRMLEAMIPEAQAAFVELLTGKQDGGPETVQRFRATVDQFNARKYEQALASYHSLPQRLREQKSLLILWINAAQRTNSPECPKALGEFQRLFPDDPAGDLVGIDLESRRENWPEVRRHIDRLDARVGGDAWLCVLRGNVFVQEGDLEAGKKSLLRSIESEPTLLNAYWSLVSVSLKERKYAETVELLTRLEKDHGVVVRKDLDQVPEYAEFVKSEEYRVWRAAHSHE
jgi:tetratricopeptide (TPR) repeat protein